MVLKSISFYGLMAACSFLACLVTSSRSISIKLFILAGQSNMVGFRSNMNDLPSRLKKSQEKVIWYNNNNQWTALQPPTEPSPTIKWWPAEKVAFGPEISFGKTISENLNQIIALVKYSKGGTSLAEDWNPEIPDSQYNLMKERVNQAIAELSALGYFVEISGFIWMQGESDASNENWAKDYEFNLTNFISQVRDDFDKPYLPFVYGMVHFGNNHHKPNGKVNCCGDIVRNAQVNVSETIPFTGLIETNNLSLHEDLLHFDSNGIITLGQNFAHSWLRINHDSDSASSIHTNQNKFSILTD